MGTSLQIASNVTGIVKFVDAARGFALVTETRPAVGNVLITARTMQQFGKPLVPNMLIELADCYPQKSGLAAARIVRADQPRDGLQGWHMCAGKFYDPALGYGFVTLMDGKDAYCSRATMSEDFPAMYTSDFKNAMLECMVYRGPRGLNAAVLRELGKGTD